jgi:hypothetical protein
MYNSDLPTRAELPSSAKLMTSTILAAIAATGLLVTTVLPADYGIDPTGAGRILGLTDMGVTKVRLAAEAEADRVASAEGEAPAQAGEAPAAAADVSNAEIAKRIASLENSVRELIRLNSAGPLAETAQPAPEEPVAMEPAKEVQQVEEVAAIPAEKPVKAIEPTAKSDSVSVNLAPGEGIEIKLVMEEGAQANFAWATEGGPVNFDTHGDGPGKKAISYEKGRGVEADEGTIVAAFTGNHGWFWRNRGDSDITLTLNTEGNYAEIKGAP